MREKTARVRYYYCPYCEVIHAGELDETKYYTGLPNTVLANDIENYAFTQHACKNSYVVDVDDVEFFEVGTVLFQCGECMEVYTDRLDAESCCD